MIYDCLCQRCGFTPLGIKLSIACEYTCCKGAANYKDFKIRCNPDSGQLRNKRTDSGQTDKSTDSMHP